MENSNEKINHEPSGEFVGIGVQGNITDYELCICGKPILGSSSTHDDGSEIDVIGHITLADMCPGFNTDE